MIASETERLILRPFHREDLELVFRLYSDPEILRYTPFDAMSREEAELHLERIIRDWELVPQQSFEFAMIRKEDGEPVGRCHILHLDAVSMLSAPGYDLHGIQGSKPLFKEIVCFIESFFQKPGQYMFQNLFCTPDRLIDLRLGNSDYGWLFDRLIYLS